jgi:hypothetical protein
MYFVKLLFHKIVFVLADQIPTSPTPLPHSTNRPVSSLSQPNGGGGGHGQNGPVSHSSPRYPPPAPGYYQQQPQQQPYWGYHQQSVE